MLTLILSVIILLPIIIAKLELADLTDSALITYTQEKIQKLTGNAPFAMVNPTLVMLQAKLDEYVLAVGKASDGTTADTIAKNARRKELQELLTLQAFDCSRISAGNMEKYATTGYAAKDTAGTPVGELSATTEILFRDYGKNNGQLVPDWAPVGNARTYTAQVYTDPANPEASKLAEVTVNPSKAEINNLPRGTQVWVRVRANGGSTNVGPWSDPANKIVP